MRVDPTNLHRRSVRLEGYDYSSPGAYFVTIVAHSYKCLFGKIIIGEVIMHRLGSIVQESWLRIPEHFTNIEVEPFIVMPNHLHGIITINEADRRGTIYRAPTVEEFGKPVVGSIPTIIRTYKAAVSRHAKRELGMTNIWQRNYYEHIIRDQNELESIAKYILGNPSTWLDDPEFIQ